MRFLAALLCAWVGGALATPPPPVALRPMPGQFPGVTEVTHAHDGTDRLFVVTQPGQIWVMQKGSPPGAQPFLDITTRVDSVNERGLLGLAFHPGFAANRRFFAFYTRLADGALQVSEFRATAPGSNQADPASERPVLTIPHPASNHNGGKLAFGPDGFLYIATGDGGGAFDPSGNAQNLDSLLGKILRIDVNPATGYAIPPGNYFASHAGGRPEVWAYGLRNPWRFSFDRPTGDLYIADVGQNQVEEVNVVRREQVVEGAFPRDFEWVRFEGDVCLGTSCTHGVAPNIVYRHDDPAGGTSITGGYVYRGMRSPGLAGWYLYGDFGNNRIWAARRAVQGTASPLAAFEVRVLVETPNLLDGISTFGEDEQGEVYVASIRDGRIYRIETAVSGENVAAASAGAVAWASSEYGAGFAASAAINGERAGRGWGSGSGWNDATPTFPDWLQVQFAGPRTIDRVVLYSMQDSPFDPVEPVDGMTFRNYGVQDFTVEAWTGSAWVTLARVANNALVKRAVEFAPITVDRIFVYITRARGGYSHLTEVEAWTPGARSETNFAHARHGSVALASSTYGAAFPPSAAIDGDRAGRGWGAGSGWNDGTTTWPDWLQVNFGAFRTIDHVVVSTLQDDVMNPIEPSDFTRFTSFGIQDFSVEAWTGASWVLLGRVTGNNRVVRHIGFPPVSVDRIFVHVTRSLGGYSHITEVEAWGTP